MMKTTFVILFDFVKAKLHSFCDYFESRAALRAAFGGSVECKMGVSKFPVCC